MIGLVLFVVVLVVSYGMGSDSPVVLADGSAYTDTGWLKITDMRVPVQRACKKQSFVEAFPDFQIF